LEPRVLALLGADGDDGGEHRERLKGVTGRHDATFQETSLGHSWNMASWRRVTPLVSQPRLLCKRPRRRLLLRRETFGDFDLHLDILVPSPAVLLDPLPREAEPLAVLRAGRHPEHHAPAVERLHLDPRAQHRLGEVDRHRADDVQALAPKEPIGLDLNYDHHVSPALGTLSLQAEPRSILRARRHGDHQALFNADLPAPSARRAPLRGDLALAAADGAGAI